MAPQTGLRQDDMLFVLFGLAYDISPEDAVTSHGRPGRLLQQGFLWSTEYVQKHAQFFAMRGNREPDGHIVFESGRLLITVEATADPDKPNLEAQLQFFSSKEYKEAVVDLDHHEIWLFASRPSVNGILAKVERFEKEVAVDVSVPLVVWSIDYDKPRSKYIVEKIRGRHSTAMPPGGTVPPPRIEVGRPQAFPLLSSHLSFPAVCFAIGRELLAEILYPRPPRTVKAYHAAFPANAVPFSYFSKAIGYLSQIVPELIEVSTGNAAARTIRVKHNLAQGDVIQKKLDEIRSCEAEREIIALVTKYQTAPSVPPPRRKKVKPTGEGTLDRFMGA